MRFQLPSFLSQSSLSPGMPPAAVPAFSPPQYPDIDTYLSGVFADAHHQIRSTIASINHHQKLPTAITIISTSFVIAYTLQSLYRHVCYCHHFTVIMPEFSADPPEFHRDQ